MSGQELVNQAPDTVFVAGTERRIRMLTGADAVELWKRYKVSPLAESFYSSVAEGNADVTLFWLRLSLEPRPSEAELSQVPIHEMAKLIAAVMGRQVREMLEAQKAAGADQLEKKTDSVT